MSVSATYYCNRDFGIIIYLVAIYRDLKSYVQDILDSGILLQQLNALFSSVLLDA